MDNNVTAEKMVDSKRVIDVKSLMSHLQQLTDPRKVRGVRYGSVLELLKHYIIF